MPAILAAIFRIIGAGWTAIKFLWPYVRPLLVWAGIMAAQVVVTKALWEQAFDRLDAMTVVYTAPTLNCAPLAFINSFFPLSEGLSMLTGYVAIVSASAAVRVTKAFIDARKVV